MPDTETSTSWTVSAVFEPPSRMVVAGSAPARLTLTRSITTLR
jgi:hypothetical protein